MPAFELQKQRQKIEVRVGELEKHAQIIGPQNEILTDRVELLAREIAELKAQEESLVRAAAASDSEVARLVATYTGQLDEAALASKSLVDKLHPNSSGTNHHMHYYQCLDTIDKLQVAMQGQFKSTAERVGDCVRVNNELPSPWKEFLPFGAQNVPELLHVAKTEHMRISKNSLVLAKDKLVFDVQAEMLAALSAEADRLLMLDGHKELLERCRSLSAVGGLCESADAVISKCAAELADPAIKQIRENTIPLGYRQALDMLNSSYNELAGVQTVSIDEKIESVLRPFDFQLNVAENILQALVDERSMIDGWSSLWSKVSKDLDRQNNDLVKQKSGLESSAGAVAGSQQQLIHPDDVLALSLKKLLSMSVKTSNAVLSLTEPGSGSAHGSSKNAAAELFQTLLDSRADVDSDMQIEEIDDIYRQHQTRRDSWLSQDAAFTSWELLLADAKECNLLKNMADNSVDAESRMCLNSEQKIAGANNLMKAALQGGDEYSGSEALDILPVAVKDLLGELKYQAGVQRKRVTRATMLAEEPSKAIDSDYAALFCQFY
ncbi:hypothetical protein IWW45_000795 [Coemansia sp. RSA 485]|nr:hypothetical protein IWW45_000795 [Coemansia sp. RSA 485]